LSPFATVFQKIMLDQKRNSDPTSEVISRANKREAKLRRRSMKISM